MAVLVRVFGDIDVAEEAVQDAFTAAVERWPSTGLPPSPAGWIITTARNRAIDRFRREASRADRHAQAALRHAGSQPAEEGARRECEEEIGRVPHRLERLCGLYPTPGFCDEKLIFFRASDLRPPPPDSPHHPDADEDITTRTVGVDEARAMLERGEIVDLKTAYALTLI